MDQVVRDLRGPLWRRHVVALPNHHSWNRSSDGHPSGEFARRV